MEKYIEAEMEIVEFESEDVITTSDNCEGKCYEDFCYDDSCESYECGIHLCGTDCIAD